MAAPIPKCGSVATGHLFQSLKLAKDCFKMLQDYPYDLSVSRSPAVWLASDISLKSQTETMSLAPQ